MAQESVYTKENFVTVIDNGVKGHGESLTTILKPNVKPSTYDNYVRNSIENV